MGIRPALFPTCFAISITVIFVSTTAAFDPCDVSIPCTVGECGVDPWTCNGYRQCTNTGWLYRPCPNGTYTPASITECSEICSSTVEDVCGEPPTAAPPTCPPYTGPSTTIPPPEPCDSTFTCGTNGECFADINSCNRYFLCNQQTKEPRTCGPGLVFNAVTNACACIYYTDDVNCNERCGLTTPYSESTAQTTDITSTESSVTFTSPDITSPLSTSHSDTESTSSATSTTSSSVSTTSIASTSSTETSTIEFTASDTSGPELSSSDATPTISFTVTSMPSTTETSTDMSSSTITTTPGETTSDTPDSTTFTDTTPPTVTSMPATPETSTDTSSSTLTTTPGETTSDMSDSTTFTDATASIPTTPSQSMPTSTDTTVGIPKSTTEVSTDMSSSTTTTHGETTSDKPDSTTFTDTTASVPSTPLQSMPSPPGTTVDMPTPTISRTPQSSTSYPPSTTFNPVSPTTTATTSTITASSSPTMVSISSSTNESGIDSIPTTESVPVTTIPEDGPNVYIWVGLAAGITCVVAAGVVVLIKFAIPRLKKPRPYADTSTLDDNLYDRLDEDLQKTYEYDYRSLSSQCKDYAVELLDLCRSTEEITALLDEDGTDRSGGGHAGHGLARVKLALKYEQKRFIAHATCQRQLISLWYSGIPWMRHQTIVVKLLAVPVATLLLPFMSFAFLIAPGNKWVGNKLRSPFVKFLNHTCAYIVFLVLVFISTLRSGSANTWLDMACYGFTTTLPFSAVSVLIFIWVLGMCMHESRQLFREGPINYVTDWWNWMDSSLILLYLAHFSLQVVVFVKVSRLDSYTKTLICPNLTQTMSCRQMDCVVQQVERNWTMCNPNGNCATVDNLYGPQSKGDILDTMSDMNQLSDIFFALASVLSFARIAHLLPANEQLGPLLVSFGRMLIDVARFGVVFILVFTAFMCGLTGLYRGHQCENKHFSSIDRSLSSLFWATFGMGNTQATLIDNRYLGTNRGLISSHTKHNALVVLFGYALFWSYIAGAVVVLLNMLIAMMSNSFQEIYDDRDVEWKFARAKLWIDFFEDGCTLPTPFNLIPSPKYICRFFVWIKQKLENTRDPPPVQLAYIYQRRKNGMIDDDITQVKMPEKPKAVYYAISQRLIQRYIYKSQADQRATQHYDNDLATVKSDVTELSASITKLRHELRHLCSLTPSEPRNNNNGLMRESRSKSVYQTIPENNIANNIKHVPKNIELEL